MEQGSVVLGQERKIDGILSLDHRLPMFERVMPGVNAFLSYSHFQHASRHSPME